MTSKDTIMNIGIIGAGNIGAVLAQKLAAAGHVVKLANSRGPESLSEVVRGTSITAVEKEEVARDADVVILSVPYAKNPDVAELLAAAPADAIVIDTSNYYPMRDGDIPEVNAGNPETVWASEQDGRPLVKACNAILSQTLAEGASKMGKPGRIAIPIAGDGAAAKAVVTELVSLTGFDAVDAGTLAESWRLQPGTPAYCTDLTADEVVIALTKASKERAAANRDRIMQSIADGTVPIRRAEMVANNRALSI